MAYGHERTNVSRMAEREGFEPSRGIAPPYQFSKLTPSATWVPLLGFLIVAF
jgi:hypothetical protein